MKIRVGTALRHVADAPYSLFFTRMWQEVVQYHPSLVWIHFSSPPKLKAPDADESSFATTSNSDGGKNKKKKDDGNHAPGNHTSNSHYDPESQAWNSTARTFQMLLHYCVAFSVLAWFLIAQYPDDDQSCLRYTDEASCHAHYARWLIVHRCI